MAYCMMFPDTIEEFMNDYKVVDTEGIYMSKGAELIPIIRMKQWFDHVKFAGVQEIVRCKDCKHFDKTTKTCTAGAYPVRRSPEWFCADAERRKK